MTNRVWTIISLAVLLGACLAASPEPTPEVPTTSTASPTTSTLLPTTFKTTTTAPPTTSTLPPTTSTAAPTTSTAAPTTSTAAPTTSTAAPTTSTTPPTTTTNIPSTTPVPEPVIQEGTWNVTEGNMTCILATLKIEFTVNVGDKKYDIALSPEAETTGSTCKASNETQLLELSFENYILAFEFAKDSDGVFVKNVTFYLSVSGEIENFYNDTKLFPVKSGNSYMCRSSETVPMGNATMHVYSIHIQAFGGEGQKDFGTAEECAADDSISDIVPIAVACALAGLIVVVLIAYLVGRRRNRQKGYTSV